MHVIRLLAIGGLVLVAVPAMAADAQHGKQLFARCAKCHSVTDSNDDSALVGPSLKGIVGRKSASLEDFRYSTAMRQSGLTWTDENLKEYIADPQAKVKGNRMALSGSLEPGEIDDIIAYLKTLK
jgi:cytochrome c